jgi:Putative Flp pilus-assembly TadE/G-like
MLAHLRCLVRSRARGQATPWLIGAILVVILMLGLIGDGMLLFAAHRRAELLAESAARAGARQIDSQLAFDNPHAPPQLDVAAAQTIARDYVLSQQPDAVVDTRADPDTILVTVHVQVPPTILHPPGQPTVDVVADGIAHPFVGLASAEP